MRRILLTLLPLLVLPALAPAAAAQRGGQANTAQAITPPPLQFHYMGPMTGGRVASIAGVDDDPNVFYVGNASGGLFKTTDGGQTLLPIFDTQDVAAIGAITVAPSDDNTVWVGTGEPWVIRPSDVIGDGVYKSTDAGAHWQNMGLEQSGRIARILVNPTDVNTVYVCSEGKLTGPEQERGVYKSTDGGATWKRVLFVGPLASCSSLSLDAHDSNTLFAGIWHVTQNTWDEASGGNDSGIYVTHDAGVNWTHVTDAGLPKEPLGKIDVEVAPSDSKRVYALIQTADQGSVWRSDDGGTHWQVVSWDRSLIGRAGYYIKMVINPKDEDDVLISSSSFHRSTNGGKTFNGNGGGGAPAAPPAAATGAGAEAAAGGAGAARGGGAAGRGGGGRGAISCGDCHDIWIDADNPARYALTDDGGASIATGNSNGAASVHVSLPNGQMYHVAVDNRVPYWIYSNRQDDSTYRGPSTLSETTGSAALPEAEFMPSGGGRGGRGGAGGFGGGAAAAAGGGGRNGALSAPAPTLPAGFSRGPAQPGGGGARGGGEAPAWQRDIGGCESGFTVPDPTDANIVWATCYGNKLTRYDAREGESRSVEPWEISLDSPPNQAKYRCHWTAPLAVDPFDHNTVYYGCQMILKTSDQGQSWTEFSPDLSTKDPSRIVSNGGIVGNNLGQYDGEVVWAIAPSTLQKGLIWAGTNDGKLWLTRDAGKTWNDVSKNLGLPVWGQFDRIAPSTFAPGTAYVAADLHLVDDYKPYLLKTTDYGATWTRITSNLPASNPLDYTMSIAENPNKQGMLFAGTAHGFFYSNDDGASWTQYKAGLPPSPVSWIVVEPRFHDVVVSTYGRGLYILPDIATFEQTGSPTPPAAQSVKLYAPTPLFRQARAVFPTAAEPVRPPFQFDLAQAPSAPVTMEILDLKGKLVRKQEVTAHAGLNGVYWDLHYDGPTLVALRTTPPENPHIWDEPRFQGRDVRTITHWGITQTTGIPLAAPGDYTVRFTIDGQSYTQPFKILKDPAVVSSDADLQASTAAQVEIRDDITHTSTLVNQMEVWRRQIEDSLKKGPDAAGAAALNGLNQSILTTELELVTKSEMLSDDKYFPEAYKVYMNLIWLSGGVGQGASDEAGGLDYRPTDTQMKVLALIESQLATAQSDFDKLKAGPVAAFNQRYGATLGSMK